MKEFLSFVSNKYFLWLVIISGALISFKVNGCIKSNYQEELDTYKRQVEGKLTAQEQELQSANLALGIAKSELVTKEELAKRLEKEKEELDQKFKAFVKKHELEISSKDETIARLLQQINGGSSGTVILGCDALQSEIQKCIISYKWQDVLGRFKLNDPNIFTQNDELFTSEQYFKVYGEIWKQKNGSLMTRRMTLREVQKLSNGSYKQIDGAKAEIVESEFVYQNEPSSVTEFSLSDLFRIRFVVGADVVFVRDLGKTGLSTGIEFLNFNGFGLGSHTMLDFKDITASQQHLSFVYNPTIFGSELNLALGASVGTPFNRLFSEYSISADLLFYINN